MAAVELFLLLGVLGAVLLVVGLVGGELLDGVFDAIGVDSAGGFFSTEVIGGFLSAFGFGAFLLDGAGLDRIVVLGGGGAAGLAMGGLALWLSRSLMNVNTDVTPTSSDLRGALGKVITRIPEGGLGEVRVSRHGHPLKLSARAEEAIDPGVEIVVVDVLSPTSVLVIRSEIEIG